MEVEVTHADLHATLMARGVGRTKDDDSDADVADVVGSQSHHASSSNGISLAQFVWECSMPGNQIPAHTTIANIVDGLRAVK